MGDNRQQGPAPIMEVPDLVGQDDATLCSPQERLQEPILLGGRDRRGEAQEQPGRQLDSGGACQVD